MEVKQPIQITPECTLIPPQLLPKSLMRHLSFVNESTGEWQSETTALVYRDPQFKWVILKDEASSFEAHQKINEVVNYKFAEAIDLLILACGASPRKSWTYDYVDDEGWPADTPSGSSLSGPSSHNVKVDEAIAQRCSTLRAGKSWIAAHHVRLAIERLAVARGRHTPAEKAIEYGTCLEVLLMHELGAEQKSEISFKMRVRAAWLVGDSAERRKDIYKQVQQLYELRSKAVHNGTLRGSRKKGELSDQDIVGVLEKADFLCVNLMEKIVIDGTPDWNSVILNVVE